MAKSRKPIIAQEKAIHANTEDIIDNKQFESVMESLPAEKRSVILSALKQESFSGPLPPPIYYDGYEKVLPGSANRILTMTESQVNHRISIEGQIVKRSLNQKTVGIIMGGLLALVILLIAAFLALKGHDWLAGIMVSTTILGVIVVFVLGQKPDSKEKEVENNR